MEGVRNRSRQFGFTRSYKQHSYHAPALMEVLQIVFYILGAWHSPHTRHLYPVLMVVYLIDPTLPDDASFREVQSFERVNIFSNVFIDYLIKCTCKKSNKFYLSSRMQKCYKAIYWTISTCTCKCNNQYVLYIIDIIYSWI